MSTFNFDDFYKQLKQTAIQNDSPISSPNKKSNSNNHTTTTITPTNIPYGTSTTTPINNTSQLNPNTISHTNEISTCPPFPSPSPSPFSSLPIQTTIVNSTTSHQPANLQVSIPKPDITTNNSKPTTPPVSTKPTTSPPISPTATPPKPSPLPPATVKFSELLLKPELLKGLNESGYVQCSPVQRDCLPHALEGKNIFCKATPGIGKTLVFVIPTLQKLEDRPEVQAVIIGNTPEMVSQIYNEFDKVGRYLKYMQLFSIHEHSSPGNWRLSNIVIGTPHKVSNIMKKMDISSNCTFVLDEADKLRYKEDEVHIRDVFNMLPKQKQVILTATANDPELMSTFNKLVSHPSYWFTFKDSDLMPAPLLHKYQLVNNVDEKLKKLLAILESIEFNQMIIFVNHKPTVLKLVNFLRDQEFNVLEMSADRNFEERMREIEQFKKFKTRLMVSTDMLSRGIDIKHVNIVLNFDMAQRSDTYLRRVGRAARFGKKGMAISFLESTDDVVMRKQVEDRFNIKFQLLSLQIEPSTYMNQVTEL